MNKIVACVLILSVVACSSRGKKGAGDVDADQQATFDRGLRALDDQEYAEAAKIFDNLLLQKPASGLDLATLYNSGSAHEGMGDCKAAAERFRQIVRSSAGKFKRIESESLFRLSLCYECLGQDTKAITALLDARKRGDDLPPETTGAEIPARLAAAYARLGNGQKAMEYFNIASNGLKGIVSHGGSIVQLNLLGRTLFLMGQLSPNQRRADVDPNGFLHSLSMQQPYLLQAMELKRDPWAAKAEDDLRLAYQNIWKFKFSDPARRHEFYTRSLQVTNELRKIRMLKSPAEVDALFSMLDKNERDLQNELAKSPETTPLTPESEKREGLRRQGRLVNPDGSKTKDPHSDE